MNEFMSQGILEVEKVLNESQTFQSIQDPVVQIDEAAELQKVLDMKYSEKNDDDHVDIWIEILVTSPCNLGQLIEDTNWMSKKYWSRIND